MRRKKLADFIKPLKIPSLYAHAVTGQIVIADVNPEPAGDETPDPTTCTKCGKHQGMHRTYEPGANKDYDHPIIKNLCCRCYVEAGNPPADWHTECKQVAEEINSKITGQLIMQELQDKIKNKLAGDERPVLPELRGGETLVNPRSGKTYRVHKVRKPKRDTGFLEPLFRLENVVVGNQEWTGQELAEAGLVLENV